MSEPGLGSAQHGTFAVDDVRLHYVKQGAGPLVLCVHGFPRHWYAFRHILAHFGNDYTVVAVDLRGTNLSTRPAKLRDNACAVQRGLATRANEVFTYGLFEGAIGHFHRNLAAALR